MQDFERFDVRGRRAAGVELLAQRPLLPAR